MRLPDFILANVQPILAEWEDFARRVWPAAAPVDPAELRDHAEEILRATAHDMTSSQSAMQQSDKSRGDQRAGEDGACLNGASEVHAVGRVSSGFSLPAVVGQLAQKIWDYAEGEVWEIPRLKQPGGASKVTRPVSLGTTVGPPRL